MFAMNRQQADEDPNVITGTSNAFDCLALVLIDSGATHSCLSPQFASIVNVQPISLDHEFELSILTEETVRINWELKNCLIFVGVELMEADLVPLHIVDSYLIFRMYWLSRYHAHIGCYRKLVFLRPPRRPQVEFQGERRIIPNSLIFCLRAKRLLSKRCAGYIAHVTVKIKK